MNYYFALKQSHFYLNRQTNTDSFSNYLIVAPDFIYFANTFIYQ